MAIGEVKSMRELGGNPGLGAVLSAPFVNNAHHLNASGGILHEMKILNFGDHLVKGKAPVDCH